MGISHRCNIGKKNPSVVTSTAFADSYARGPTNGQYSSHMTKT